MGARPEAPALAHARERLWRLSDLLQPNCEAAGHRNWPEAVPKKMNGGKRGIAGLSENRHQVWTQTSDGKRGTRNGGPKRKMPAPRSKRVIPLMRSAGVNTATVSLYNV